MKANLEEKQDKISCLHQPGEEELNQLHADIENTKIEIEKLIENIDDLEARKSKRKKRRQRISKRLIKEGDRMTLERLEAR